MKKVFLTIFSFMAFFYQSKAQTELSNSFNKAIFVEFLGNGIGISANYDMRLKRGAQDGFGFRTGIGGQNFSGANEGGQTASIGILTLPLSVNYLIGKKRNAFEAGLGVTPIYSNAAVENNNRTIYDRGLSSSGFLNLGYRFQPLNNGFVFRFNWAPAFNSTGFSPSWVGISAGYGFK
jgi:hypothetical protein